MTAVPIVLLGSLLVVAAFVVFRIVVRRDYRSKRRLSWVSSFLETAIFALWAWYTYANSPATWPALHVSTFAAIVGWTLFAGGMTLTLVAMIWLGLRRTFGQDIGKLRSSGIYGLTRNPQAVAFTIGMLGYMVLWPSWQGAVAFALLITLLHMMVVTEEEHLLAAYGDEYVRYTRLVPRYLGTKRRGR
jgi:protein-S-isoprenylcysteine O-methyltransferase Ste14